MQSETQIPAASAAIFFTVSYEVCIASRVSHPDNAPAASAAAGNKRYRAHFFMAHLLSSSLVCPGKAAQNQKTNSTSIFTSSIVKLFNYKRPADIYTKK